MEIKQVKKVKKDKRALNFIYFFLFVVFLSALGSPFLYFFGKCFGNLIAPYNFEPLKWLSEKLLDSDFPRYFNRAVLISALILVIPLAKSLKINNLNELGLKKNTQKFKHLIISFSLACLLLILMGSCYCLFDWYELRQIPRWHRLSSALPAAAAVSLLEEFTFRGLFLFLTLKVFNKKGAILLVSVIFAAVHFIKPMSETSGAFIEEKINIFSGFLMFTKIGLQFSKPIFLISEFATLFLIGIILAHFALKTKSLFCSIGLHAGWIFGLRAFSCFFRFLDTDSLPWAGKNLKIGIFPLITVLITAYLLDRYTKQTTR